MVKKIKGEFIMKKRLMACVLALCMTLGSACSLPEGTFAGGSVITASAKEGAIIETKDLQYIELADGTLEVKDYIGKGGAVTIPQTVGGQTVTSIGERAFDYQKDITSVSIPDTVTAIGKCAFYGCSLTSVSLPQKLTSMGNGAFEYCRGLKEVTIPGSLKAVPERAFFECEGLEKLTIKEGTMRLMTSAFDACLKLSQVSLPSTLAVIGSMAFWANDSLKSISIPNNVVQIGNSAFGCCDLLENITLPDSLTAIGAGAFRNCKKLKSIVIPSGVTAIGDETFWECKALESITFKGKVTSIGKNAFSFCEKLENISLPDSLTSLGSSTFCRCKALKSIKIPSKVTTIAASTFDDCISLESVTLPENLTEIGYCAFETCRSLKSIKLPGKLKIVGKNAFAGCSSLTSLTIPDSVTSVDEMAFYQLDGVKTIEVPRTVVDIGYIAFGCTYNETLDYWKVKEDFKLICQRGSAAETYAKNTKVNYTAHARIAGNDRYATATRISFNTFSKSDRVVIAYGLNYADALAGVPIANALGAPILLTAKDSLSADTLAEIKRLGATKATILGGEGVISQKVEAQLKSNGVSFERVAGSTRFETSVKAAKRLEAAAGAPSEVFFVSGGGFADALSVSSVAAIRKAPIIYLNANGTIDSATRSYLASMKGKIKKAYVIGGTGAVSDSALKAAGSLLGITPTRVDGSNRYATSVAVANTFKSIFTSTSICAAKGLDFPDALAGGVFAARQKAPMILADNQLTSYHNTYLKSKNVETIFALGGTGAVPDSVVKSMAAISQ